MKRYFILFILLLFLFILFLSLFLFLFLLGKEEGGKEKEGGKGWAEDDDLELSDDEEVVQPSRRSSKVPIMLFTLYFILLELIGTIQPEGSANLAY